MFWGFYWAAPLVSAVVWFGMLLAMLIWWLVNGSPKFSSMQKSQSIAFISDVGAQELKPLFITGSAITVVLLDLVLIAERWLRHRGKLARNTSLIQKIFAVLSILFAIAGAAGLILLSIFDTVSYPRLHDAFLALFIVGYVLSAICVCIEFWRLERNTRSRPILRISFYVKLLFIIVEVALAIVFGVTERTDEWNTAAIVEWVIAAIFTLYILSFVIDFLPSARTEGSEVARPPMNMAMSGAHPEEQTGPSGRYYGAGNPIEYPTSNTTKSGPASAASNF